LLDLWRVGSSVSAKYPQEAILWRGPTFGAASFRDKETIRKRCWLRVRMTHRRSISGLRNVRFSPIPLKNSMLI
jgi:hypothetical protein